ncbi:MAG: carboxypeptidase regulatory-like domain-containing protein, partial [Saprospiraceae bacterium]|nr:carboxypeptidase regulatory-like domain-containing protein [Saprospiraceae bacterium]
MKKLCFVVLTALLSLQNTQAQSKIFGKIHSTDNTTFEFVNVLLMNALDTTLVKGTITDSLGQYEFDNVNPGSYFIKGSMVGFGNGVSDVIDYHGQYDLEISTISLTGGVELSEVVVKA